MTKDELEYERMLKQMDELQKKLSDKKDVLDKERDEAIIKAIHEINITREQGVALAEILKNEDNFETIMKLMPKAEERTAKKRKRVVDITNKESEVIKDEE